MTKHKTLLNFNGFTKNLHTRILPVVYVTDGYFDYYINQTAPYVAISYVANYKYCTLKDV